MEKGIGGNVKIPNEIFFPNADIPSLEKI